MPCPYWILVAREASRSGAISGYSWMTQSSHFARRLGRTRRSGGGGGAGFLLDESEKVGVDLVGVRGGHAVGETGVRLQRAVLQLLDGDRAAGLEGADLIVFAVHDENGNVDALEVVEEIG